MTAYLTSSSLARWTRVPISFSLCVNVDKSNTQIEQSICLYGQNLGTDRETKHMGHVEKGWFTERASAHHLFKDLANKILKPSASLEIVDFTCP